MGVLLRTHITTDLHLRNLYKPFVCSSSGLKGDLAM